MTKSLAARLKTALRLLEKHQGVKSWPGPSDPLDSLMLTILSQNTNDKLRDQAYEELRRRWPTWEAVVKAPTKQVEQAIRIGGLSQQKAARLQEVLRWIKERFGSISLEALEPLPDDDVIELLTSQKGVGIKTAGVVLMFALGRDICPVDTHVHRISGRLGWVPVNATAEKTFWLLRPHVPRGCAHSLHMNLLQFGRTVCHARKPLCVECFLYDECVWEGKVEIMEKGKNVA